MDFSPATFLYNDWQQAPCVFRSFFDSFADPVDEHDIAGLAQEEGIDARIVSHQDGNWTVTDGPFDDYSDLCHGHWTLLVQGVDKYIDEVAALTHNFRFIPDWRIDDVMVSFATSGAGVGPHVDQYDVFLIQGRGRRRWRVGAPGHYQTVYPHPKLRQINGFETHLEVTLNPGDVLYIPPGWPHDGVSVDDSLTYSVGFRAPDTRILCDALSEIADKQPAELFRDPLRRPAKQPACVSAMDRQALKGMLHDMIASDAFDDELMRKLSEQHLPVWPSETLYTAQSLQQRLAQGVSLSPVPGCRPLFKDTLTQSPLHFYIDGTAYTLTTTDVKFVEHFARGETLHVDTMGTPPSLAICETLATLVNKGYWLLEEV
ncbi:JmjC domain-containing protein [Alteromonas halophila]|uniref:50S ribosomal protein L16 arginine hydroxylase n=1 Tax=Alteromonas halophila TaxID=516698 RepID=A0A918JM92_9ALTE|nr:cupin domain-containing protein [Alteromonas halophila]GGW89132.1 50S ribosomal protein L16 arginine hydroxylase [Alteromonas halophila]